MNVDLTRREMERLCDRLTGAQETDALDVSITAKLRQHLRNHAASGDPEEAARKWQDNHGNKEKWPTHG